MLPLQTSYIKVIHYCAYLCFVILIIINIPNTTIGKVTNKPHSSSLGYVMFSPLRSVTLLVTRIEIIRYPDHNYIYSIRSFK